MKQSPQPDRRRILAAGAGALVTGFFGRAQAQDKVLSLPFANGERRLAVYPEKRPLIVLTSRPPQLYSTKNSDGVRM